MTGRSAILALVPLGLMAPSAACAQEVGLLLGLAKPGVSDGRVQRPQGFSTHWIMSTGSGARDVVVLSGLIVPGPSGFSRVLVTRHCGEIAEEQVVCADSLRVQPANQPVPVLYGFELTVEPCATDDFELAHASPRFLSLYRHRMTGERCDMPDEQELATWVRGYESEEPIPFSTLGPGAAEAFADAARRAVNKGGPGGEPQPQTEVCQADPTGDTQWSIGRGGTGWQGQLAQTAYGGLCDLSQVISWGLPASVVGYEERPLDWSAIRRSAPDVESAFGSPDGALVLLVGSRTLRLHAMAAGALGAMLREYPRSDVVMVQWALGRSVTRWTQMLSAFPKTADVPEPPPSIDWNLTLRGAGPVRFGMTVDEAGKAADGDVPDVAATWDCDDWMPEAALSDDAVPVFQVRDGRVTHATLPLLTAQARTATGARPGMTEAEVQKLYGGRLEIRPDPERGLPEHWLVFTSTAPADSLYRVVFQTDGDRVQWIRAGLLPHVFELGGCR